MGSESLYRLISTLTPIIPPGELGARTRLESKQLEQRKQLENLDSEQLQRAGKDTPPPFRPQEREQMKQERRPLLE